MLRFKSTAAVVLLVVLVLVGGYSIQILEVAADGFNVSFSSSEQNGVTSNLGTITAFGDTMVLPRTRGPDPGSYSVLYTPAGGYIFVMWEKTGGCSVQDVNAASTTLIVVSSCSVTAIYHVAPVCIATAAGGATACALASSGVLSVFSAVSVGSLSPAPPSGSTFPFGLFSIADSGLSAGQIVTVTITLSQPLPAGSFSYWKFQSGAWSQFTSATLDPTRTIITLTFTAPSSGCPCTVTDPGGPAITPAIIPEYPLGLPLLAIFMIISYGLIRRRTRNPENI